GEGKGEGQQPGKPTDGTGDANAQKSHPEIEDLLKKLKGNDPKAREEAAQKLKELMRNAQDAGTRKAASEALENAGEPKPGAEKGADNKPGASKNPKAEQGKPEESGMGKGKAPEPMGNAGQKQPGNPMEPGGMGQDGQGAGKKDGNAEAPGNKPGDKGGKDKGEGADPSQGGKNGSDAGTGAQNPDGPR